METTSSSSGDGKGRWKYFCSLFMTLVCMTVALHSINMRKGRGKGARGSDCKGFQSYANSHAGYAQELRAAVPAASPSVTDLQLLLFLLLFLILLQLLLLLLLFLLLHLLLLFPLLLLFHLFCCCRFLCIFCMLHTFVRLLRQFSTNSICLPPLLTPSPRRAALACTFQGIVRLVRRVSRVVS